MSEFPLPRTKYAADTYKTALENLVERYAQLGEPVKYSEAALDGMSAPTSSSCLKFLMQVGLLNVEKQGVYTPKRVVVDYVENDYEPTSSENGELKKLLRSNEIFEEAEFFLNRGEYENTELAGEIVQQEEDLDDDVVGNVVRFLEILEEMNLLGADFDQDTSETKPPQETEDEDTSPKEIESVSYEFSFDEMPRRTRPEDVIEIGAVLKQGGNWSSDDLKEETEIGSNYLPGGLQLGEQLGFFNQTDEGVILTKEGYEFAFSDEEQKQEEFREGLRGLNSYIELLKELHSHSEEEISLIQNTDLIEVMRTEFGLTEPDEAVLKRSMTGLFKTLEAAGFGEYKEASGGYPSRFSFDDSQNLETLLDDVLIRDDETIDETKTEERSGGSVEKNREEKPENLEESVDTSEKEVSKESRNEEDQFKTSSQQDKKILTDGMSSPPEINAKPKENIEIQVEIDLSKLDSAELEAKLELLEEFLRN